MRIRLLNDGGFTGLSMVLFPVMVPEEYVNIRGERAFVDAGFMQGIGGLVKKEDIGKDDFYVFISDEFEVMP